MPAVPRQDKRSDLCRRGRTPRNRRVEQLLPQTIIAGRIGHCQPQPHRHHRIHRRAGRREQPLAMPLDDVYRPVGQRQLGRMHQPHRPRRIPRINSGNRHSYRRARTLVTHPAVIQHDHCSAACPQPARGAFLRGHVLPRIAGVVVPIPKPPVR